MKASEGWTECKGGGGEPWQYEVKCGRDVPCSNHRQSISTTYLLCVKEVWVGFGWYHISIPFPAHQYCLGGASPPSAPEWPTPAAGS